MVIGLQSCETEIPPEDSTPPEFSFRISGNSVNYTFNQDTDFDNIKLNLQRDAFYNFTFTGSDDRGVDRIQWDMLPSSGISIVSSIPSPWTSRYTEGNVHTRWNGDRSNPLTGSIISGRFRVPHRRERLIFRCSVTDFGGEARRPNTITKELNVSTGSQAHIGVIPI